MYLINSVSTHDEAKIFPYPLMEQLKSLKKYISVKVEGQHVLALLLQYCQKTKKCQKCQKYIRVIWRATYDIYFNVFTIYWVLLTYQ